MQESPTLPATGSTDISADQHGRLRVSVVRFLQRKPLGALGGVILVITVVWAVFAPVIAPYGYNETALSDRLDGPSASHILGTDELGRDLFSRVTYGARVSIMIAFLAVIGAMLLALLTGGLLGYIGGWYDLLFLRIVDSFLALPTLVVAVVLVALFGQGVLNLVIVLGFARGIQLSRVVRASVLDVKHQDYVEAARSVGAGGLRIMLKHILPNIMPVMIVLGTTAIGGIVLAEAALSFLGYGVPPPQPTWGAMLTGSAVQYMTDNPWMMIWPGLALALTVYSANMFGDALRDVLDPRLRGS